MSYQLTFHPEATVEFVAASLWYAEKAEGLELRFESAVEKTISSILNNPETYGYAEKSYREALIKDFPYVIVYKVDKSANTIFIVAIYNTSRNPGKKYR